MSGTAAEARQDDVKAKANGGEQLLQRPKRGLIAVDTAVVDRPALFIGTGLDFLARDLAEGFGFVR
jgi:hypothetical protein